MLYVYVAISVKSDDVTVTLEQKLTGYKAEKYRKIWLALREWSDVKVRKKKTFFDSVLRMSKEERAIKAIIFTKELSGQKPNYLPVQIKGADEAIEFLRRMYTMEDTEQDNDTAKNGENETSLHHETVRTTKKYEFAFVVF